MVYLEAARLTEVRAPEQTFQRLIAGVLSAWSGLVLLDFSDSSHLRQNFTPPPQNIPEMPSHRISSLLAI